MTAGFFATVFRFVIFFLNFAFVILGGLTFNYGLKLHSMMDKTGDAVAADGTPISLMVLGGLVFIVAFFGCCGAFKESSCMLRTYAILILVLLLLQLFVAYRVYKQPDLIKTGLKKNLERFVQDYKTSNASRQLMDEIQSSSLCCGVESYRDYEKLNIPIPFSCCPDTIANQTCPEDKAFKDGCLGQVVETWNDNLNILKYVGIFVILFQVISIGMAYSLASNIRRAYDVV